MDVKQRVVFSQKRPPDKDDKGDAKGNSAVMVCAEPSPDALTVLGVSGGLSLNNGQSATNATADLSESGAFVGLRLNSFSSCETPCTVYVKVTHPVRSLILTLPRCSADTKAQ